MSSNAAQHWSRFATLNGESAHSTVHLGKAIRFGGAVARPDDTEMTRQLRALVAEHGRAVESLLMYLEHDPATQEDLWSEVFTITYSRIDKLEGLTPEQTRGWLLRCARNVTANTARRSVTRRKLEARLSQTPEPTEPSAEDTYFGGRRDCSSTDAVKAAWAELSEVHQQVLILDAHGHDGPAIADELGITALAARSRLMRARRAFLAAHDGASTS